MDQSGPSEVLHRLMKSFWWAYEIHLIGCHKLCEGMSYYSISLNTSIFGGFSEGLTQRRDSSDVMAKPKQVILIRRILVF